jgi:hypothetical protein
MLKQKWRTGEVSRETITAIARSAEAPGDHHERYTSLSLGLLDLYSDGDEFLSWKRRGVGRSSHPEESNPYWLEDAVSGEG